MGQVTTLIKPAWTFISPECSPRYIFAVYLFALTPVPRLSRNACGTIMEVVPVPRWILNHRGFFTTVLVATVGITMGKADASEAGRPSALLERSLG